MSEIKFEHLPHDICRVTSKFGYRTNPVTGVKGVFHQGIDFGANKAGVAGDKLYAVADGVVVRSANMPSKVDGYGYYIVIQHKGFCTLYAHMLGLILNVGDKVKVGQIIGYMGSTGASTATHLHFEVEPIGWSNYWKKENGIRKYAVNPFSYIINYRKEVEKVADIKEEVRYINISEMPEWMQAKVTEWVNKKLIKGDLSGNLDLTEDMIRVLIIAERMNQI